MRTIAILAAGVATVVVAPLAAADPPTTQALYELFQDRLEWRLEEFPRWAMSRGDYRHADRIRDDSLAAIERRNRDTQGHLERLLGLDKSKLSAGDQVNYDLFEWLLRREIDRHHFRVFVTPLGARWGPQYEVPQMCERVRFASAQDYANYLTRLECVPRAVDNVIELMKLGLKEGRTPPRVTMKGVPDQFRGLLEEGQLSRLGEPLGEMRGVDDEPQRVALRQRFETVSFPGVRGALEKLRDFVVDEYLPKCRTTIAASDLPDGAAFYASELRYFTTTEMSAREIHELGLREVARVRAEMMDVIRSTDFMERHAHARELDDPSLFKAFVHYLQTDSRFYYSEPNELVRGYRDICKRIDYELPRLFKTLPRLTYGVRPIPAYAAPEQTTGYFQPGDLRNAQASTFYVNTYALDQRPKYEMIPLSLHESVPGHHFQSSLAKELEDVPEFRKDLWIQSFGEGWALYAERLGLEMGLYADPYDNFGRLLFELWRACRLVVDPGLHALGWTRAQAIEFMRENTALSEVNIRTEIDRYIQWPGQATCYKIGEIRIRALRARAEERLGARFDLREFHDMLLGAGTIPLTVLEQRVDAWIAARQQEKGQAAAGGV
jgi:uncharacterized protein (DUF885 family)